MERKKTIPLLVLSVSSLVSAIGYSSWVVTDFNEKQSDIKTSPSSPVCYIQSSPNVKYTSIEKALSVAGSNDVADTVVVIPGANPTIRESCVINAKDTLLIPYDGETCNRDLKNTDASLLESGPFSDDSSTSVAKNRRSEVVIKSTDSNGKSITLENNGKLVIGGELGLGTSKQRPSGHTNGLYSQITMEDGSAISNFGTIECYGYIKGTKENSAAKVSNQENASFYQPFVIDDFKGGSFSNAGNNQKVFPFNIFELPNCQVTNEFYYGASLNVWLAIYAQSTYVPDPSKLVGSSGALFNVNSGKATIKYCSPSFPYTKVDIGSNTDSSKINKMKILIDGSVSFNSMSLSVGSLSLSTGDFFAPISYKFDVEICNGANLSFEKKTKFLSGASLTIDSGGTASFDSDSVFYQSFVDDTTYVPGQYPTKLGSAILLNNGTLNLNSNFGGFVETTSNTGKIVAGTSFTSSVKTQEMISTESGGTKWTYEEITSPGFGLISENGTDTTKACFLQNNTYLSEGQYWKGSKGSTDVVEQKSDTKTGKYCILPCSLILMSDGSYKFAKDIRTGDSVISFNHETGRLEPNVVIGNDDINKPVDQYNVVHLEFSNGQSTDFVYEHGYFDATLNRYVYMHEDDAKNFVGHEFVCVDSHLKMSHARLVKVSIREEVTKLASPATANHLNFIADNMLSIGGGLSGLFNIFDYNPSTLAFDKKKMDEDIKLYGFLGYESFEKYFPKEIYDLLPCKYLGVSIGKGLITWDIFEGYVNQWKDQLMENMK